MSKADRAAWAVAAGISLLGCLSARTANDVIAEHLSYFAAIYFAARTMQP